MTAALAFLSLGPAAAQPSAVDGVRQSIVAIDQAVRKKDAEALSKLARFPLAASYFEYEMEARIKSTSFPDVATALKKHSLWDMKPEFIAVAKKRAPLRGLAPCSSDAPVDWSKGPQAIKIEGDKATVTAQTEPCGAANHFEIWQFERTDAGWLLVKVQAEQPS